MDTARHADLWRRIKGNTYKLDCIKWVKAHVRKGNAAGLAGYERFGNDRADALATKGIRRHRDVQQEVCDCSYAVTRTMRIQRKLLERHKQLAENKLVETGQQEARVIRLESRVR